VDKRQRVLIGAAAGGAGLLAAGAVAVAVMAGRGGTSRVRTTATTAPATTSTTDLTETTLALEPVDSPTTNAPPQSSTTTATTALAAALSGQGAVLIPSSAAGRLLPDGSGCSALGDGAGWTVQCGQLGPSAIWLTETRPAAAGSTATRAYVLRPADPATNSTVASGHAGAAPTTTATTTKSTTATTTSAPTATTSPGGTLWAVALAEQDDAGGRFGGLDAASGGVRGDGSQAVVFGFRQPGAAGVLSLDLVEVPPATTRPSVSVHMDLTRGSVRLSTGELDLWAASYVPGDATCCPSAFVHQVIQYQADAWRVVAASRISPANVPPSQV